MTISITEYNLGAYYVPDDVKEGICVDVGSNVGCFFEKYADIFSSVHFYEPYGPCYEICLEKSKNYPNVVGYNEAVLDKCLDEVDLVPHFNLDSGSNAIKGDSINEHWGGEPVAKCKTVDLETILQRCGGKIDYLKCDCETSEYNFLYNKDLTQVKYIALELHWQMGKEKYDDLLEYILTTHNLIPRPELSSDISHQIDQNKELLFKIKYKIKK
jgi:FkbM family methyltransferase